VSIGVSGNQVKSRQVNVVKQSYTYKYSPLLVIIIIILIIIITTTITTITIIVIINRDELGLDRPVSA